jgi:hypothetical protein
MMTDRELMEMAAKAAGIDERDLKVKLITNQSGTFGAFYPSVS